jgi:hypothetical protein
MQNYAFVNDVSSSSSDDDSYEYYSFKEQKKNKNKPKHKYLKANNQRGGLDDDNNDNDRPTGGFPNIVLCADNDSGQEVKDNNITRREIAPDKAILSISQILKSRRNI